MLPIQLLKRLGEKNKYQNGGDRINGYKPLLGLGPIEDKPDPTPNGLVEWYFSQSWPRPSWLTTWAWFVAF
jgi:hypothetical protein